MSWTRRLELFLRSPRGRHLIALGRRELAKPANQQRLRQFVARMSGRR